MKFTFAAFSAMTVMSGSAWAVDEDASGSLRGGRGLAGQPDQRGPPAQRWYDCDAGCGFDEVGYGPPVCGVDGNTYFNACIAYCQDIDIERPGVCAGDKPINPNDDSYVREGRVSKAEMDEFKTEKFKFTAKRKFPDRKPDLVEPVGAGPGEDNSSQLPTPPGLIRAKRITRQGLEYVSDDVPELPAGYMPETSPTEGVLGSNPQPLDDDQHRALSVIGQDTRTETDGFSWPNWRLGQVEQCEGSSCSPFCSGSIIGANAVMTNQHCVFSPTRNEWYLPEKFTPGRFGGGQDPWGSWNVRYATTYTTSDWSYDVAVLTMNSFGTGFNMPIGQYMGTLGMKVQPCSYNEAAMRITGYPGDKPSRTMWTTGQCEDWSYTCGDRKIYHKCDTAGGMSGSAIRDGSSTVVGVHSHGGSTWNSGMAFTAPVLADVMRWAGLA